MALSNEEATLAFRQVSVALREVGLAWVVNQVEEKVALGKVQTKKLQARSTPDYYESLSVFEDPATPRSRKGPSPHFAVSEEYSPQERLDVLLDSLEFAVSVIAAVSEQAFENLRQFGVQTTVLFAPEADVSEEYELTLAAVRSKAEANSLLLALLGELRTEDTSANQAEPAR